MVTRCVLGWADITSTWFNDRATFVMLGGTVPPRLFPKVVCWASVPPLAGTLGVRVQGSARGAGEGAGVRPAGEAQPDVPGIRLHLRREQGQLPPAGGIGKTVYCVCVCDEDHFKWSQKT